MQERWDLVECYPAQLRSFVPVFTTYTDSAFPTDAPTDKGLRVALRYEVGRFFASLERFKQATTRHSLSEAYIAYSEMSLHLDRYLRVGGLYTYYDDMISTEPYFKGISDDTLVFANPRKDPPLVRDLVILIQGPDKGKTGIVIGMYEDGKALGPSAAVHDVIRDVGRGAHSHWRFATGPHVMLSTSDNSDPNTNGRHYEARP